LAMEKRGSYKAVGHRKGRADSHRKVTKSALREKRSFPALVSEKEAMGGVVE